MTALSPTSNRVGLFRGPILLHARSIPHMKPLWYGIRSATAHLVEAIATILILPLVLFALLECVDS